MVNNFMQRDAVKYGTQIVSLDDWLTVHRTSSITLVNFQLDAQNYLFTYLFIYLYI